ncbi:MAG: hypothetical protein K8S27_09180 [Candidatus Omnitrophica bacterium]|nr:hypothetical protein [Candidatus Omnitrophota bacterium]
MHFQKLIGGQIVSDSECPVRYIDVIAMAVIPIPLNNDQTQFCFSRRFSENIRIKIEQFINGFGIKYGLKILDPTTFRCAGQPELSPDPGKEPRALAAESVFEELYNK